MVSVKEDLVDFNKLEKDLFDALEADARYDRENDAKFRAVNQKVANYDEFRDIVLASHIKPLEKKDRIDQIDRFTQPWNVHGKPSSFSTADAGNTNIKSSSKIPSNGHEFARNWRRDCKTDADKYLYLLEIGAQNLSKIFRAEISLGLLGDIICALNAGLSQEEDSAVVCDILLVLSSVNRFKLSVQFLSSSEKEKCSELVRKVERLSGRTNDVAKICEVYELLR